MNKILCIILFTFIYFNIYAGSPHPQNTPTPEYSIIKIYTETLDTAKTLSPKISNQIEAYMVSATYSYTADRKGSTITAMIRSNVVSLVATQLPTYTTGAKFIESYYVPTATVTRTP